MKVWDCFLFRNEHVLLDVRVDELRGVVDRFVAVQSIHTFRGTRKDLELDAFVHNKHVDLRVIDVLDTPVIAESPWVRERHQRNAILRGLADAAPDDIIMVSDVDEIPRRSTVEQIKAVGVEGSGVALQQTMYLYRFNLKSPWQTWLGTRATTRAMLSTPQVLRDNIVLPVIPDAGWHFSWLARKSQAAEDVLDKQRSFSHAELDARADPATVERAINERSYWWQPDDENHLMHTVIDETYPSYVQRHLWDLRDYIE